MSYVVVSHGGKYAYYRPSCVDDGGIASWTTDLCRAKRWELHDEAIAEATHEFNAGRGFRVIPDPEAVTQRCKVEFNEDGSLASVEAL